MPDEPDEPAPPKPPESESSSKSDLIALGIGCAVFIIMFVAIVLVSMSGR